MVIGIFPTMDPRMGGVYQYCVSLLESLSKINKKNCSFVLFSDVETHPIFKQLENRGWKIIILKKTDLLGFSKRFLSIPFTRPWINLIVEMPLELISWIFARFVKNLGVDIAIFPTTNSLSYRLNIPYVVTIHDFQHKYLPDFFSSDEIAERDEVFCQAGNKAKAIVCESGYVKDDLVRFIDAQIKKIFVLSSPPSSSFNSFVFNSKKNREVAEKYKLPGKYLFYPAQFWPHKNHSRLLLALKIIARKYRLKLPLVLVGSDKGYLSQVNDEAAKLHLKGQVFYLGHVPDEDMPYLYKNSFVLVVPSLFESLSIPIWEAFFLGVPVVSSNVCALPEQVGKAGLLFDPSNVENMAGVIVKVWRDTRLRKRLIGEGKKRLKLVSSSFYSKGWVNLLNTVEKERSNKFL